MTDLELGPVIARREYDLSDGGKVILEVGTPRPEGANENWFCAFRILGLGYDAGLSAGGVDAVQALILALTCAATYLYTSDFYRENKLTWVGSRNLKLPVADAIADLVPKDDA